MIINPLYLRKFKKPIPEQDNSPVSDENLDYILVLMVDQFCESLEHYPEVRDKVLNLVRSGRAKGPAEAYDLSRRLFDY